MLCNTQAHNCTIYIFEERRHHAELVTIRNNVGGDEQLSFSPWEMITEQKDDSRVHIIGFEEGNLCGWLVGNRRDRDSIEIEYISSKTDYDPSYRGTGRCLVEQLIVYAREAGMKYIWAMAIASALSFYWRIGFDSIHFEDSGGGMVYKCLDSTADIYALKEMYRIHIESLPGVVISRSLPPERPIVSKPCHHRTLLINPDELEKLGYDIPLCTGAIVIFNDGGETAGILAHHYDDIVFLHVVEKSSYSCLLQKFLEGRDVASASVADPILLRFGFSRYELTEIYHLKGEVIQFVYNVFYVKAKDSLSIATEIFSRESKRNYQSILQTKF